jgi:hypothetical protein
MAHTIRNTPNLLYARWLLRIALAFSFGYAAISSFLMPTAWIGFIPTYVPDQFKQSSLDFFSVVQLIVVAWLLSGWRQRTVALLSGLLITALTLANVSAFLITFRDVSLALAAFSLMLISTDND